jgi:hypothetical protein
MKKRRPKPDSIGLNQTLALSLCLSSISGQTLHVCCVGKPVSTFLDHAMDRARRASSVRCASRLNREGAWLISIQRMLHRLIRSSIAIVASH